VNEASQRGTVSVQSAPTRPRVDTVYSHDGIFTVVRNMLETIVVVLFIVTFVVQPSRIPSASMVPTLKVGDYMLVDKQAFAPQGRLDRVLLPRTALHRGDLAVFHYPVDADITLVKRVIGVPGDRLYMHAGKVYINGSELTEPYTFYSSARVNHYRDEFPSQTEYPNDIVQTDWWLELRRRQVNGVLVVPPGEYFVMGDNRNDSDDSRYWGFVGQNAVVGRPLLVYFTKPAPGPRGAVDRIDAEWHSLHVPR
jgi:signal peptidase I